MKALALTYLFVFCALTALTQVDIYGIAKNTEGDRLSYSKVTLINHHNPSDFIKMETLADEHGRFYFEDIPKGEYSLEIKSLYHKTLTKRFELKDESIEMNFELQADSELKKVVVYGDDSEFEGSSMRMVEGVTVTHGKKTQLVDLNKVNANKSINNARELYATVPGLNIWESDGGGLQLGIGARGLSPSRTAHFNTRQNGYDISADALGYPESYYTPPAEAIEKIQLIRGAASLQFGPQFGGMLNFKLMEPSKKPISYKGSHTYGAYNLVNTFNAVSGTIKKRITYLGYYQYKQGDGWRENSGFHQHQAFGQIGIHFSDNLRLRLEHTYMSYLAQQAGGLTDALFEQNPRQSIRERNWFAVDWNITALNLNWQPKNKTTIDLKAFRVDARRQALGNLEKISRIDDLSERDLIDGNFNNFGAELRLLQRYPIGKKMFGALAGGVRYYQGLTSSKQGKADDGYDANFEFLNPDNLEGSDYDFPSQNAAAFVENILWLNKKLSISGGLRYEYIQTKAEGYYREMVFHPLTGTLIFDTTYTETKSNSRSILLGGIGFSYHPSKKTEVYGNIAQNYRGINFSDIRLSNPNQVVDPDISDEKGFNADFGYRGRTKNLLFDVSAFFLFYDNKIGIINHKINDYEFVRLRTNVGRAYSTGVELYGEQKFKKTDSSETYFSVFANCSFVYARYGKHEETALSQKWVELVPPLSAKMGLRFHHKKWNFSVLASYIHEHYTDGTNAQFDPNAIAGIIPSYYVLDYAMNYKLNKIFTFSGGVNNFTNNKYFSRRATGYPGPGIIPSDGISFYLTLGIQL
ncbi:MAG: TonB-dependent receptor [Flavobacteriales bacterium]|nr:TonB-dependent receptor [Flavobacteriales bacterium]